MIQGTPAVVVVYLGGKSLVQLCDVELFQNKHYGVVQCISTLQANLHIPFVFNFGKNFSEMLFSVALGSWKVTNVHNEALRFGF